MAAPSSATDMGVISLRDLIDFISHVADCYPDITKAFPGELVEILSCHHTALDPDLREKIVGSLVLLRKKEIIDSSMYDGFYAFALSSFLTSQGSYKLSSRFLSRRRARISEHCCSRRSFPTCDPPIRRRQTIN